MIIVTGGTGFIGHHLLQELLLQEKKIRACYRGSFPDFFSEELKNKIDWQVGDILDVDFLDEFIAEGNQVF